jgi:hypothetical protein
MKPSARIASESLFILLSCQILFSSASAAPPAVTYLYPAGAQRGTTVDVTVAGTLGDSAKVWAGGKGVAAEAAKGKLKVTVAKDAVPGAHWLRAYNAEGASTLRPFFVGTLPEVMEKEPNDDYRKPQAITGDAVVNGKLDKNGDVDCFAVQLKKGQTLVAALEAHRTLRSPMDGMLQVLSPGGFVLEENNDFHGLDPQVAFTAKKDGAHVVRVYAFPAQPDSGIRYFGSDACVYRLTLTTGPFADFAMPLALGADDKGEVEARGWNLPPEARKFTVAAEPGEPFATVFGPNLANTLRLRSEPHPVFAKPTGTPKPPFSATGSIESPRGESRVTFEGKKGQALTVQVESRSLGLPVNPVVRLLDKNGMLLTRAEPGKLNGDATLTYTPTSDGPITAAVGDLYAGGGPRHAFLLRVLTEPDYELSVTADRFTLVPGKPTTVPVKVTRLRGFTKPVEVVAEGLPEGVKAEVTKPAKPDPNAVTLSLTAEKPVNGAFRLVGKVKGEPKLTRLAHAPLPEFEESTADLWLTPGAADPPPKKKKR